jgi:hypothetical protein
MHHDLINAEFASEQAELFPRYEGLYRPRTVANIHYGMSLGKDAVPKGKESQLNQREKLGSILKARDLSAFVMPSTGGRRPIAA